MTRRSPVILHISDLHRTVDERVSNDEILHSLKRDFDQGWTEDKVPHPDLLVVSGDLTQRAEPEEYDEAIALLAEILNHLNLDWDRVVTVPGNHDIHWPTCEEVFRWRKGTVDDDLAIRKDGAFLVPDSSDAYQARLDNFRNAHHRITGREWPRPREEQFLVYRFDDLGIAFGAMSSCDRTDYERSEAAIHPSVVKRCADELMGFDGLRVAVWHHDCDWRHERLEDTVSYDTLAAVNQRGFDIALCGHTHRPASHDVNFFGKVSLPLLAAGSLCAGPQQRGDSVPRSYNIIRLDGRSVTVWVRQKADKAGPWQAIPFSIGGGNFKSHYQIDLNRAEELQTDEISRTRAKAPTPFGQTNARHNHRARSDFDFVWTSAADAIDSGDRHIVLGPRGAGKSALLLSLTASSRRLRYEEPDVLLTRLGILCAPGVHELTAFTGKGWLTEEERAELFSGFLAAHVANGLVTSIEEALHLRNSEKAPEIVLSLAERWFGDETRGEVRDMIDGMLRLVNTALSERDQTERERIRAQLRRIPLFAGGVAAVVPESLSTPFDETQWAILFDEAEHLNEWQQAVVFRSFHADSRITTKVATLPYGHIRVLGTMSPPLVAGDDFHEIPLAAPADKDGLKDFAAVAEEIWQRRVGPAPALSEVWPSTDWETVLADAGHPRTRDELEEEMILQLSPGPAERARRLRAEDPSAFSDQYWRRYKEPFRFRFVKRLDAESAIPLYWGVDTLLKACDGNFRWFLLFLNECWREYWEADGLRPLTAAEQHRAATQWAASIARKCGAFGERATELSDVITKIVSRMNTSLHGGSLTEQTGRAEVSEVVQEQREAIALGIAYGFLVPERESAGWSYPLDSVELRLGYPIAIRNSLPLRRGTVARIADLRQVVFDWWRP